MDMSLKQTSISIYHRRMNTITTLNELWTMEQVKAFLDGTQTVAFEVAKER